MFKSIRESLIFAMDSPRHCMNYFMSGEVILFNDGLTLLSFLLFIEGNVTLSVHERAEMKCGNT